jgi:hypothetical protein
MPNSDIHRTFKCPVCGYDKLNEPPYDEALATFAICPCCGTEFGYDDSTMKHSALRQQWIDNGGGVSQTALRWDGILLGSLRM